jgi:biopolymer transport protein ExbD
MAEIQQTVSGNKRRKPRTPRIDLTPMVDLGFLLITFFMYTTTLARPKVMELQMPDVPPTPATPTVIPEATLVIIPTEGHRIAYYPGTQHDLSTIGWCTF